MTDLALGDASVTSVTEYLLTQPILSFVVCGCAAVPERMDRDEYSDGDSMDEDEGGESAVTMREGLFDTRRNVAMIKLHCVHTRLILNSLHFLSIKYFTNIFWLTVVVLVVFVCFRFFIFIAPCFTECVCKLCDVTSAFSNV